MLRNSLDPDSMNMDPPDSWLTCAVWIPAGVILKDHALVGDEHDGVRHGGGAGQALDPGVGGLGSAPSVLGQHRPGT